MLSCIVPRMPKHCVAVGRAVVYCAQDAQAFSARIKTCSSSLVRQAVSHNSWSLEQVELGDFCSTCSSQSRPKYLQPQLENV